MRFLWCHRRIDTAGSSQASRLELQAEQGREETKASRELDATTAWTTASPRSTIVLRCFYALSRWA